MTGKDTLIGPSNQWTVGPMTSHLNLDKEIDSGNYDDKLNVDISLDEVKVAFIHVFSVCSAVIVTVSVDGHAVEGQGTRLFCTLKRNISSNTNIPRITWEEIVNGSPVQIVQYQSSAAFVNPPYNDRFSVVKNDSQHTLVINNTKRTDDGTYKCEVSLVGDVPSSASDDVTISVAYLSYPTLVTKSMTLNEGDTATFTCVSGEGKPEPRVTLLKDDEILSNGQFETSLVLSNVTKSNEGNYTCRAENDLLTGTNGKLSRETATLTVITSTTIGVPIISMSTDVIPGSFFRRASEGNVVTLRFCNAFTSPETRSTLTSTAFTTY
ncbi:uncharacterized protein LOC117124960, partial [Anneissia japonica]|uniref:uncharacterized protein LOC117124960 n=1 Tax=Anneissia japonica TaxID=1529436 RepID=UPI001425B913